LAALIAPTLPSIPLASTVSLAIAGGVVSLSGPISPGTHALGPLLSRVLPLGAHLGPLFRPHLLGSLASLGALFSGPVTAILVATLTATIPPLVQGQGIVLSILRRGLDTPPIVGIRPLG